MLRLTLCLCLTLLACDALASRVVGNETWSGKMVLDGEVKVPAGATLILEPGTELFFPAGATLIVEGRLVANGSVEAPVRFLPREDSVPAVWQGLSFHQGSVEGSELQHVSIEGAMQAVEVTTSKVRIVSSSLSGGSKGVVSGGGALITLEGVSVKEMSEAAIDANAGSQGSISGCRIEGGQGVGIQLGKKALVAVRDNHISGVKVGILASGEMLPVTGNTLQRCEAGIVIMQTGPPTVVRGNRIQDAQVGIACHQFASPIVEGNIIERCDKGIDCFQMSSPIIRQNRLANNRLALSAVQMCNAAVTRNEFLDNTTAVYLHLSSYVRLNENNFERNGRHVELDNMSYDWEVRAQKKPTRSYQVQSEMLMQRGRTANGRPGNSEIAVTVASEGFVNAMDNYWGVETTRELVVKGAKGNLTAIQDAHDVPTRTYEGWPGEYRQDKVRLDGWKRKPIAGTGPQ